MNYIANIKTQIEETTAQIEALNKKQEQLKADLAAYIAVNPTMLMEFLLNNKPVEPVPTKPQGELKTIVSVKFNSNNNKIYDYIYTSNEPVKEGDFVIVNTPYSGETKVEVVKVTQKDISNASFEYKEATIYKEPKDWYTKGWYIEEFHWNGRWWGPKSGTYTLEEALHIAETTDCDYVSCYFTHKDSERDIKRIGKNKVKELAEKAYQESLGQDYSEETHYEDGEIICPF